MIARLSWDSLHGLHPGLEGDIGSEDRPGTELWHRSRNRRRGVAALRGKPPPRFGARGAYSELARNTS